MNKTILQKFSISFFILGLFLNSFFIVFADNVSVENRVSTSANTGGNTSNSSQSSSGQAESHVEIKTTVNGEVVEDINEIVTSEYGENIKIEKKTEVNVGNVNSSVLSQINTNKSTNIDESNDGFHTKVKIENSVGEDKSNNFEEVENKEEKKVEKQRKRPIKTFFNRIFRYVFSIF